MSNGGYQRPIKKIPDEFAQAIIELIQWRKDIYQKMEPVPKGILTIDATQPDAQDRFMELWQ